MSSSLTSLYIGSVYHGRMKVDGVSTARNHFKYPLFMSYIDLDDVKTGNLFKGIPIASVNRRNIIAFHREGNLPTILSIRC